MKILLLNFQSRCAKCYSIHHNTQPDVTDNNHKQGDLSYTNRDTRHLTYYKSSAWSWLSSDVQHTNNNKIQIPPLHKKSSFMGSNIPDYVYKFADKLIIDKK